MEDRYLEGTVERISPEAPVPVVLVRSTSSRPGGAANVLANVLALGGGGVGLFAKGSRPVEKIRVMVQGRQVTRLDYDHPQLPLLSADLPYSPYIIFSDYGKGTLANIKELISSCPLSTTILVDPKGFDYKRYIGADYIKPNKAEMKELVGGWSTEEQLTEKAHNLIEALELEGLLLTRGAEGMTLYTTSRVHHVPAVAREVFDVCGAGDTAIATFTVALSLGHTPQEATTYANKAAGVAVGHLGAYVVQRSEVFL